VRRLLNLVLNRLLPLVDTGDWTIDVGTGSRSSGGRRIWVLPSAAVPYLARHGRDDLRPQAEAAARAVLQSLIDNAAYYGRSMQFTYGTLIAAMAAS
jgi:hypothetical protein